MASLTQNRSKPMNKYDFMQDMLTRALRKLDLPLEQPEAVGPTPILSKPRLAPDEQAGGFDGTADNPMPLGGNHATERILEIVDEIDERREE